jgi:hypothetical protein
MLWLTVIIGTYVIFPPYRAAPPPGTTDLSEFPRALVLANASTAWLHVFGMEIKEHMPWIASMLTTAVAFIAIRYPSATLRHPPLRTIAVSLLAIAFAIVAFVSLVDVFREQGGTTRLSGVEGRHHGYWFIRAIEHIE